MTDLYQELEFLAKDSKHNSAMFFKQGAGQYAEHDKFVGIKTPDLRKLVKKHKNIEDDSIIKLLHSPYNEYRLLALFFMVDRYQKSSVEIKNRMYELYLEKIDLVNNWNLVDVSAHLIMGAHIFNRHADESILFALSDSDNLWHRRVAVIASWHYIRCNNFRLTLDLAKKLLSDKHDLMHKAIGWMLREVGKRDMQILKKFLDEHVPSMTRVTLRYALEHFDQDQRKFYLEK